MDGWTDFAVAVCGAAAALAGLVLVGVSVNLDRVLELPGVPGRAIEALAVLLTQLCLCIALLAPNQSPIDLVDDLLLIGGAGWIAVIIVQVRARQSWATGHPAWFLLRVVLTQLATMPVLLAGVAVWSGNEAGMHWLTYAAIFSFFVAIFDAWVLLIEIKR